MFQIELTPEAIEDLRRLRKYDQEHIIAGVERQLSYQPTERSRNRKLLRPNRLSEWELRVGDFRVFYDVNDGHAVVKIAAIGHKRGNRLFVRGEEYEL